MTILRNIFAVFLSNALFGVGLFAIILYWTKERFNKSRILLLGVMSASLGIIIAAGLLLPLFGMADGQVYLRIALAIAGSEMLCMRFLYIGDDDIFYMDNILDAMCRNLFPLIGLLTVVTSLADLSILLGEGVSTFVIRLCCFAVIPVAVLLIPKTIFLFKKLVIWGKVLLHPNLTEDELSAIGATSHIEKALVMASYRLLPTFNEERNDFMPYKQFSSKNYFVSPAYNPVFADLNMDEKENYFDVLLKCVCTYYGAKRQEPGESSSEYISKELIRLANIGKTTISPSVRDWCLETMDKHRVLDEKTGRLNNFLFSKSPLAMYQSENYLTAFLFPDDVISLMSDNSDLWKAQDAKYKRLVKELNL